MVGWKSDNDDMHVTFLTPPPPLPPKIHSEHVAKLPPELFKLIRVPLTHRISTALHMLRDYIGR